MTVGKTGPGMWTTPADVIATLRRRWERGDFLTAVATDTPWVPIELPVRGPSAAEIAADFAAVREWTERWRSADTRWLRLEHRSVGGRHFGTNQIPARAWVDEPAHLWALIKVKDQVRRFADLVRYTRQHTPTLVEWLAARPHKVLTNEQIWPTLIATVLWIEANASPRTYLRQIDIPGADTKFVEQHRATLASLLDRHLPGERVDRSRPPSDFAGRYRFRKKPTYVRLRRLHPDRSPDDLYSELTVRVDELAETPARASTVYVVENEITFLAFPAVPDAILILGGGYALSNLQPLRWLHDRELNYWGDIDTHGFAILSRLRQAFPHTRSMLMDRATLMAHEGQWVAEPNPTTAPLPTLDPAEAGLYRDLVEDALGPSVRLEQERIRYSAITDALPR